MTFCGTASKRPERIGTVFAGRSVISMRRFSERALADQALADADCCGWPFRRVGEGGEQHACSAGFFGLHLVDDALLRVDQRRKFGEQHAADGGEIALALQHAGEAGEVGLQPVLLGVAVGGEAEVVDHGVDVVFQFGDFAAGFHLNRAGQVALGHGGRDFGDGADLVGEVVGEQVDVAGKVLPRAGGAGHVGLSAQPAFDADFAGDGGDLVGEGGERVGHVVDGLGERGDFALGVHGELLGQLAVGDGGHDFHDAAHLFGEVGGHDVDVVGEVLPRAGDTGHLRLSAQLAFGADFAGHAGDFGGEGVELVDHGVDGVLQLEDFALHIDGDLARQVAAGHGGRDFGDVANLAGEVSGHGVDRVGKILPGAGDAGDVGLSAETAFGADFAGHARDFGSEGAKLLDHGVERFFELQDFAAHVDGDLRDRSPLAMAVATSAMLRTWPVRLPAMKLTLSVRSFQVPATPGTCAWPPSLPSVPTSRARA